MKVEVITWEEMGKYKYLPPNMLDSYSGRTVYISYLNGQVRNKEFDSSIRVSINSAIRGMVKVAFVSEGPKVRLFALMCSKAMHVVVYRGESGWVFTIPNIKISAKGPITEEELRETFVREFYLSTIKNTPDAFRNISRLTTNFWKRFIWNVLPEKIGRKTFKYWDKFPGIGRSNATIIVNREDKFEDVMMVANSRIPLDVNYYPNSPRHTKFLLLNKGKN